MEHFLDRIIDIQFGVLAATHAMLFPTTALSKHLEKLMGGYWRLMFSTSLPQLGMIVGVMALRLLLSHPGK